MQSTAIMAAYETKSPFDSVAETTNPKAETINTATPTAIKSQGRIEKLESIYPIDVIW